MSEDFELTALAGSAVTRRLWLLYNAMRNQPFEHAFALARSAEEFIAGSPDITHNSNAEASSASEVMQSKRPDPARLTARENSPGCSSLSGMERSQLLDRLAQGEGNAEIAKAFGLSPRQVQGIRMGSAREIASLRSQSKRDAQKSASAEPGPGPRQQNDNPEPHSALNEVVQYLRQQDDVVVRHSEGEYLVNGRFRLGAADLIERANRMRSRQGKAAFMSVSAASP